jgi:prefoldin beta subunit
MQQLVLQKQRLDLELNESERALKTLEDVPSDAKVYKSAGAILVEKRKDDVVKELEERKEFLEMRSTPGRGSRASRSPSRRSSACS